MGRVKWDQIFKIDGNRQGTVITLARHQCEQCVIQGMDDKRKPQEVKARILKLLNSVRKSVCQIKL